MKFELLFIVDVYQWAVLWFPTKHVGLFGAHALRHVKLTTCLSPYVRAADSPWGLNANACLYAWIDLAS